VPLIANLDRASVSDYSHTAIGDMDPYWKLDFGTSGVPIEEVFLIGRTGTIAEQDESNSGYNVHVGESENSSKNPTCNSALIDTSKGADVPCNKAGRFMGVTRPGKDRLLLIKAAVFIDCNSPSLPWDPLSEFPLTIEFGETRAVEIPLAT